MALPEIERAVRLHAIIEGFSKLSAEELPAVFEELRKVAGNGSVGPYKATRGLFLGLARRWVALDPKAACDFATDHAATGPAQNEFQRDVMRQWYQRDARGLKAWVDDQPQGPNRVRGEGRYMRLVAESDPRAGLELVRAHPDNPNAEWAAADIFRALSKTDPAGVAAEASGLSGEARSRALATIAAVWGQKDPQAAASWAGNLANTGEREQQLAEIVKIWPDADLASAAAWAQKITDPSIRAQAFAPALSRLAGKDFSAAAAQIAELAAGPDRDALVVATVENLGRDNPAAAGRFLEMLEPGAQRNEAAAKLCAKWGETDPHAALDWFFRNGQPGKGLSELAQPIGNWISEAPQAAIGWAENLPSPEARDTALGAVVTQLSWADLPQARALFGRLSPEAQGHSAAAVADNMFRGDPIQARQWAEGLPAGAAQSAALNKVATNWAGKNEADAAQWLNTLAPGAGRDSAISGFCETVFEGKEDPATALTWALSISDEMDRDDRLTDLAHRWMWSDRKAAAAWIQSAAQLSPEQKQRLLK